MACCTNGSDTCTTCKYSEEGSITCFSPLIRKNPPEDSEWEPKDKSGEESPNANITGTL